MPENLAGQDPNPAAPASDETPVDGGLDIEKIRQEAHAAAQAAFDERAKGFQRLLAERDNALAEARRLLDDAKLASLSEDERDAEVQRRSESELERLRAENELLKLMPEYPDELPVFQRLLAAQDAKTQLDLIRELRKPAAPANPAPAAPAADPAPVDPNNPANPQSAVISSDGVVMTDELAERLLRSAARMH